MKEQIILSSIESLRREGLKFSVDSLAEKLKISKKTVYKYFPDKQSLALALYERYYAETIAQAKAVCGDESARSRLLRLYFDSRAMIRPEIFNKYNLNGQIASYTREKEDELWAVVSGSFGDRAKNESETYRLIVDGAFDKVFQQDAAADGVIAQLEQILWQTNSSVFLQCSPWRTCAANAPRKSDFPRFWAGWLRGSYSVPIWRGSPPRR